jgi:hypothetical protein
MADFTWTAKSDTSVVLTISMENDDSNEKEDRNTFIRYIEIRRLR